MKGEDEDDYSNTKYDKPIKESKQQTKKAVKASAENDKQP
jgi:hypothetical protein